MKKNDTNGRTGINEQNYFFSYFNLDIYSALTDYREFLINTDLNKTQKNILIINTNSL